MTATMKLRPYQRAAVQSIYEYYGEKDGNPLLVLPTGAGKSVIQAAFIKEALEQFPKERFLLVSHVRELLEQNADKIKTLWPGADLGFYSAGLGCRDTDSTITVAGIQSCYKKAAELGAISLVIIDECHLTPKKGDGMYRKFLADLKELNPLVKVIGMTATPYRLDSGLLHKGKGAIFTDVSYEANILDLVSDGYLCPLVSKLGASRANLNNVKIRGGEYVAGELEAAMNTDNLVTGAVDEILDLCADRNKWLLFCSGVAHATHVKDELVRRGIPTECVTGDTPSEVRSRILNDFVSGKLRAVTNVNVLTTGFDAPDIDAIMLLRPTKSTGLYCQMVGRGMRLHSSKDNTLVLDFAGNILEHGPIDRVRIGRGDASDSDVVQKAPMKECPQCGELVFLAATRCEACGKEFPERQQRRHEAKASDAEIMSGSDKRTHSIDVDRVSYFTHHKEGKPPSMRVQYHCGLTTYSEWICFEHDGYAQKKALQWWRIRKPTGLLPQSTKDAIQESPQLPIPRTIVVDTCGQYPKVVGHKNFCAQGIDESQSNLTSGRG